MYESETDNVCVRVMPNFLEDQSEHEDSVYFWSYTVEIENQGTHTIQLKSRYWCITDANGQVREVRGPGVIGQEPVIQPGKSFSYTSGAPLTTPSGFMKGSYQMEDENGDPFNVEIPAFSLDSPYANCSLN